jgi:hypothetical protein
MRGRAGEYIRGNLLGMVAIFIALGGVAWGASKPTTATAPKDSVVSRSIKDGQVKSDDLANNAVSSNTVKNHSLTGAELAADSVGGDQIDEDSLGPVPSADALTGPLTSSDLLRVGNETGTSEVPSLGSAGTYGGVVVRRVNSTTSTAGSVVARTDFLRLERDGSQGGLRIAFDPNTEILTAACQGVSNDGTPIAAVKEIFNGLPASPQQLITDDQDAAMLDCHFGSAYSAGHTTDVQLLHRHDDSFYTGFVISTLNQ